jgi:hypothetical protein
MYDLKDNSIEVGSWEKKNILKKHFFRVKIDKKS